MVLAILGIANLIQGPSLSGGLCLESWLETNQPRTCKLLVYLMIRLLAFTVQSFSPFVSFSIILQIVHSLGMKDSWGPLKALAAASAVNGVGDIVLCRFLGYGIAGAAWATMVSQVCQIFLPIRWYIVVPHSIGILDLFSPSL